MGRRKAIAVLTGDLVRSSDLSTAELARARSALESVCQQVEQWSQNALAGPVEFFRGDSWQLALGDPGFFLRAAILVRARLIAEGNEFDSRIGVGLGLFEEINPQRTSLSSGEAFTISGKSLDSLAGAPGLAVGVPGRLMDRLGWTRPLAGLCSALADHWTEKQAELVAHMLEQREMQQVQLAARLQISRQSVSKQLLAADFHPLANAVQYVEKMDWQKELARVRMVVI